ncbi:MAG: mannose-1-phosphate guanylyltransferase/mannose-6-phosphate isomerase [Legionellaceae bacterium]|nr:mannose-1-phosphate guanylyltransferase/mannose-6-phosphate isomerase [Legionellaceae bacterium]
MILPIILAGGSGTRLWPLSRELYPKQFLTLLGEQSLLQSTVLRVQGADFYDPIVVCNEEHRFLAAEQIRALGVDAQIILEPVGRNTAPAVALAALHVLQSFADVTLLILPADHIISDPVGFRQMVANAQVLVDSGSLVTFGVKPTYAETGYGYIKQGQPVSDRAFAVDAFVEKPDKDTARAYIDSERYVWNSGMFMFQASTYIRELTQYQPEMVAAVEKAVATATHDHDFIRINEDIFRSCPANSIDYAVMEKTAQAVVIAMDLDWSDVGSWSALMDLSGKDAQGNALQGDVVLDGVNDSFIRAEHRLVAAIGLDNVIIVETKDAVLVVAKDQVQKVKAVVDLMKKDGRHEHRAHRETYRPWGMYDCIDEGHRYQVKRISVKPGARLSLQMHYHRAEHWVVVSGTAKVTCGERSFLVTENQSTYIPVGEVHSLENPGKVPLELIEVQSGTYLGEDDILRIKDQYGRACDRA